MSSRKYSYVNPKKIGTRLVAERERLGLSQQQIAQRLGFKHKVSVSRFEAGKAVPGPETLAALAAIFGKSVEWLLHGRDSGKITYKVTEPPEDYGDPRRNKLVGNVKEFAGEADPDLVEALLKNVKAFKELMERRKELKET